MAEVTISSDILTALAAAGGAAGACIAFGFGISGWLQTRFDALKELFNTKLEAHQKDDNTRFEEVRNELREKDVAIARLEMAMGKSPYSITKGDVDGS